MELLMKHTAWFGFAALILSVWGIPLIETIAGATLFTLFFSIPDFFE